MTDSNFDASKYLTKLSGKDYLEVKWRLLWLRTLHPDAVIETELVKHGAGLALFRARVTIPGAGSATGWGSETAEDFGDFIEKAETKSLGRALAALGYGTQFCEDFDFTAETKEPRRRRSSTNRQTSTAQRKTGRVVDSPVARNHRCLEGSARSGRCIARCHDRHDSVGARHRLPQLGRLSPADRQRGHGRSTVAGCAA